MEQLSQETAALFLPLTTAVPVAPTYSFAATAASVPGDLTVLAERQCSPSTVFAKSVSATLRQHISEQKFPHRGGINYMGYTSSLYQMEVVLRYLFGQDKQTQ